MLDLRKKAIALGMAGIMAVSFAACAKTEETTQASQTEATAATDATEATQESQGSQESKDTPAEADKFYFIINGYNLKIGDTFEDVKDKLGKEIKPAEDIGACDPQGRSDFAYFYDGVEVTVHFDGKVTRMYVDEENKGAATLAGIALGDSVDKVKSTLGEPTGEDESSIDYMNDKINMTIRLEGGIVTGIDMSDINAV